MNRLNELIGDSKDLTAFDECRERAKKYMNTFTDEELKAIVRVHCDYRMNRYVHGNRANRVETLLELAPDLHWLDLFMICQARKIMYSKHLGCDEVLMFACVDYPQLQPDAPEIDLSPMWEV